MPNRISDWGSTGPTSSLSVVVQVGGSSGSRDAPAGANEPLGNIGPRDPYRVPLDEGEESCVAEVGSDSHDMEFADEGLWVTN